MNVRHFILRVSLVGMLVGTLSKAEAADRPVNGDVAGTGLTSRIDLNNDGQLADWATWVEKSNLGQASVQGVIEGVVVSPTGACPAGQLETALVGGSIVDTFQDARDQLFIQATSRVLCFDTDTLTFSAHTTATITGGTGKFAGAKGSLDYRFTGAERLTAPDQSFASFAGTVSGTISLPEGREEDHARSKD